MANSPLVTYTRLSPNHSGKHRLEHIPKLSHFVSPNKKGDISAARHFTLFTLLRTRPIKSLSR